MASNKEIKSQAEARRKAYEAKIAEVEIKAAKRKNDNRLAIIISALALLLVIGSGIGRQSYLAAQPTPTDTANPVQTNGAAVPPKTIAGGRTWNGYLTVNGQKLTATLDGKNAPQAVSNFLNLERSGFYKNVTCHRLTTSGIYVLQCGDPQGTGAGGPGYAFGPVENAPASQIYKTGVLAMARQGNNSYSMGSQFFIVYKDSNIPNDSVGGYTVFGQVTSGLQVVNAIAKAGVQGGGQDGKPVTSTVLGPISFN